MEKRRRREEREQRRLYRITEKRTTKLGETKRQKDEDTLVHIHRRSWPPQRIYSKAKENNCQVIVGVCLVYGEEPFRTTTRLTDRLMKIHKSVYQRLLKQESLGSEQFLDTGHSYRSILIYIFYSLMPFIFSYL